jgi:GR25 family glycosyltransferase involved in LPS biosynthesis
MLVPIRIAALFLLLLCLLFVIDHCSCQQLNVINLAKDTKRWDRLQKEFNSHKNDLPLEKIFRLDAVNGKDLSKEEVQDNATLGARLFCTLGTIGCYISHRFFWERTLEGSDPYQIVLEDDVVLEQDFHSRAHAMVTELEETVGTGEWDVLLLGGLGCINPSKRYGAFVIPAFCSGGCRPPRTISEHIHIPMRPFGTHAYALSKRGAEKLLQLARKAAYHVDCVIWGMPELDLFICDPLLAYQDYSCISTVGSITSGIETMIPTKIKMDDYTKMPLVWVWNEPVIRIPLLNVVITQGRYLIFGIIGTLVGLLQRNVRPWILPAHCAFYVTFMVTFNRLINRPAA